MNRSGGRTAAVLAASALLVVTGAPYKVPRTWAFFDAFPLTGSGKVQKFVLREQYLKGELEPEP